MSASLSAAVRRACEPLPELLREAVVRHWEDFLEAAGEAGIEPPRHPETLRVLFRVWAGSGFVARSCVRDPALLAELLASGDLLAPCAPGGFAERVGPLLEGVTEEEVLHGRLRRFRRREMVRIVWRDLAGWAPLEETVEELSALAEACIDGALGCLEAWQREALGTPCDTAGEAQRLVVLGMGKLGARELNLSSDVDLVFAYPEEGETRGAEPGIANEEFFQRLGRRLIQALDTATGDGFVFRVDMRLRPYGASGPLAMGFDAMEEYYQEQGREWERYAMVKARVVAGDRESGARLMAALRPFVYRRYLDFGAFESLRDMKVLIAREVRRKGLEDNVKLGAGGIREVEFIGQAFQLIRGGRDTRLQERRILRVLELLGASGYLPEYAVRELADAYVFLRRVEHRLQAVADQQTQSLPQDEEGRVRLAFAMGYPDWDRFEAALRGHMAVVHGHFEQVAEAPQAEAATSEQVAAEGELDGVWRGAVDRAQGEALLAAAGFEPPGEAYHLLEALRTGSAARVLGRQGRERLERLMPLLLNAVGAQENPLAALRRVLGIVEAIAGRSAYLALLVENPMALSQLVHLCAGSPWIATELARHPLLLDELLDPRALYAPPRGAALDDELRQQMLRLPEDDLEQQMEVLRHFRQAQVLRVAAADIVGALPLMKVSDHLTEIAETVLRQVVEVAWRHMAERHGSPVAGRAGTATPGFAVLAYGKLGGLELGYGSDLDVVFLHAGDPEAETDGARPLPNGVFFARLGQRIIHILNTRTPAGILYEVDTRLRPSGASGLLVSGIDAFAEYQREDAWTWEHQALVRARVVAGDPLLGERFAGVREEVLTRPREARELRREVREMRQRMRAALGSGGRGRFDLKQDPGGIADIEFVVQYGVLLWSREHPELLQHTDNIRILEGFARAGLMPEPEVALLSDAYRAYREVVHRRALQQEDAVLEAGAFAEFREGVSAVWNRLLEAAS